MKSAIEKLQDNLKQDPSNFQARRELAVALAYQGFNEEALANLQYLAKYFPNDADLQYNLGILYEKLKDFKSAKIAYEKALDISPQEDYFYNLGEVLVELEDWDRAINNFNQVLKTDSNDSNAYFNIGYCFYKKNDKKNAIDNLQKAVDLNPKDIYALFYLGSIYQEEGLTNFAQENYRKILEISPDYSWAYYNLAQIAYTNGNLDDTKEYLLKDIEYNKDDIDAYKLLIKIYLKNTETEEAIQLLENRIQNDENGDLFYLLAQVYKFIDDKVNYIKNLRNAIKNPMSLTYPIDLVKKEYQYIRGQNKNFVENLHEIEEYNPEDFEVDNNQDFEDAKTGENLDNHDENSLEEENFYDDEIEDDDNEYVEPDEEGEEAEEDLDEESEEYGEDDE